MSTRIKDVESNVFCGFKWPKEYVPILRCPLVPSFINCAYYEGAIDLLIHKIHCLVNKDISEISSPESLSIVYAHDSRNFSVLETRLKQSFTYPQALERIDFVCLPDFLSTTQELDHNKQLIIFFDCLPALLKDLKDLQTINNLFDKSSTCIFFWNIALKQPEVKLALKTLSKIQFSSLLLRCKPKPVEKYEVELAPPPPPPPKKSIPKPPVKPVVPKEEPLQTQPIEALIKVVEVEPPKTEEDSPHEENYSESVPEQEPKIVDPQQPNIPFLTPDKDNPYVFIPKEKPTPPIYTPSSLVNSNHTFLLQKDEEFRPSAYAKANNIKKLMLERVPVVVGCMLLTILVLVACFAA